MSELKDRIPELNSEIVNRVEAISRQREDKKTNMTAYNETIKALEAERDALIAELNAIKEQIKQNALVAAADELIEANASPADDNLSLID